MIKFFRKIRQRLVTESKFSKYLLYAIGEVILVVIGILIALQINNWNENRKNKAKEQELLVALEIDFKETKIRLQETINLQTRTVNYSRLLLEHYEANKLLEIKDSIPIYVGVGFLSWWRAEPVTRTYQSMISTGNIELIRNKTLKRNLAELQTEIDSGFEDQLESMALLDALNNKFSNYGFSLKNEEVRKYIGLRPWENSQYNELIDDDRIVKLQIDHPIFDLATKRLDLEIHRLEQQHKMSEFVDNTLDILQNEIHD